MTDVPPSTPEPQPPPPPPPPPPQPAPGAPAPGMPTAPAPVRGPLGKARNPWISILLFVVTLGIYGLVWAYKVFDELKQHTGQGIGGVAGLLIQIFVGVVNAFLLPSEIRNAYEGDGLESPVTPVVGFWILLPIVGAIVWYVKVQNAMNAYWVSKGAPPA